MASRRLASLMTLSPGTKTNSASLSTNFLISHGQATRSTFTFSRVIHLIAFSLLVCAIKKVPLARQPFHQLVNPARDEIPSDIEIIADGRTLVPTLFALTRREFATRVARE